MLVKKIILTTVRINTLVTAAMLTIVCIMCISCNSVLDKKPKHLKAATGEKILLDRPGYTLAYPAGWTIDSSSKIYDIDGHFTLHSPIESGLITFFIFNVQKDEEETLNRHIKAQLAASMKDGTVSYFNRWGNYKGHGARITGRLEGLYKSELEIFVYGSKDQSFLIVSVCGNGYREELLPGLQLVASSFKLKNAKVVILPANHS
jgi:hypothetical protein